jgi:hypothetical protein
MEVAGKVLVANVMHSAMRHCPTCYTAFKLFFSLRDITLQWVTDDLALEVSCITSGYGHSRRSHCDQVVIAFLSAFAINSLYYIDFR